MIIWPSSGSRPCFHCGGRCRLLIRAVRGRSGQSSTGRVEIIEAVCDADAVEGVAVWFLLLLVVMIVSLLVLVDDVELLVAWHGCSGLVELDELVSRCALGLLLELEHMLLSTVIHRATARVYQYHGLCRCGFFFHFGLTFLAICWSWWAKSDFILIHLAHESLFSSISIVASSLVHLLYPINIAFLFLVVIWAYFQILSLLPA